MSSEDTPEQLKRVPASAREQSSILDQHTPDSTNNAHLQRMSSDGIFVLSSEKQPSKNSSTRPYDAELAFQVDPVQQFNLREFKSNLINDTHSQSGCAKHQDVVDGDCGDCNLPLNCGVTSSNDSDAQYGTPSQQHYQQSMMDLHHQIQHLEAVNSKLVPDLERYEAEIYELRERIAELERSHVVKDREQYQLQRQLDEAKAQIITQEQVIKTVGAQQEMAQALLEQKKEGEMVQSESQQEQDHTWEMLSDIQQKLSELGSIEKAQREITEMKNQHLNTIQKLNDAKRKEEVANETNAQLLDRIARLESDLDHQKFLNKDLKREKQQHEQISLQQTAKADQLAEILKMFQPDSDRHAQQEAGPYTERNVVTNTPQAMIVGDYEMDMLRENSMVPPEPEFFQHMSTYKETGSDHEVVGQELRSGDQVSPLAEDEQLCVEDPEKVTESGKTGEVYELVAYDVASGANLVQEESLAAENEEAMDTQEDLHFPIQVKREEEQLSMEDGPSFVSPNGSFDYSNIVKGQVRESALNEINVQDPTETRRSKADEQLIAELRAANEKHEQQTKETQQMFMKAIQQLSAKFEKFETQASDPDEKDLEFQRKASLVSSQSMGIPAMSKQSPTERKMKSSLQGVLMTQRSLGGLQTKNKSYSNNDKAFTIQPKPTTSVDSNGGIGNARVPAPLLRGLGALPFRSSVQKQANSRRSEYQKRSNVMQADEVGSGPPYQNIKLIPTGATETARSNILSSGSFPTSIGGNSVYSMNRLQTKTTLGGLMGANDQLWRKNANKGVWSETGSANNQNIAALSAKSPSIHKQSTISHGGQSSNIPHKSFGSSNLGVSPSHFSLKATNSYRSPEVGSPCVTEAKKQNKKKLNIKGSILDDIRVDENGKHYLPTSGYRSPEKKLTNRKEEFKSFLQNGVSTLTGLVATQKQKTANIPLKRTPQKSEDTPQNNNKNTPKPAQATVGPMGDTPIPAGQARVNQSGSGGSKDGVSGAKTGSFVGNRPIPTVGMFQLGGLANSAFAPSLWKQTPATFLKAQVQSGNKKADTQDTTSTPK